jgi:hypothetical protein
LDQEYELAPPPVRSLVESLRGVGYSVPTAIADLVDNSISAGARTVWLTFAYHGRDSYVSLLDDGRGMDDRGLYRAMILGSRNPTAPRDLSDLGRFGLGLKTASFSQCRRLTVASRRDGSLTVKRWDLDHIARSDVSDWHLLSGAAPGSESRLAALDALSAGTLVLWERLDRITDGWTDGPRSHDAFLALVDRVEEHLAMVFHRYLEGSSPDLRIFINGITEAARIRPWDPFLADAAATIRTPLDRITTPSGTVEVRGYVLPHKEFLAAKEYEAGGGPEGWTAQQGFYVYRNRRMLVAGGWLGLGDHRAWTREEPHKLARIQLDIPNTADEDWNIDIKKSAARPPPQLRPRLKALADYVRTQAKQVFAHRGSYGKASTPADLVQAWRTTEVNSAAGYRIARDHPAVRRVIELAGTNTAAVEAMLRILEETVPVQRIWLDAVDRGEVRPAAFAGQPPAELQGVLEGLYRHLTRKVGLRPPEARQRLLSTEPFQNYPEMVAALADPSTTETT